VKTIIICVVATVTSQATAAGKPLPSLFELLPTDTKKFYRYEGSLTTPTCNSAVVWTVFETPLTVSAAQVC